VAAFVQGRGAFSEGAVASIALAFAGAVTAGNDLVVGASQDAVWSIVFTDSETNSYTDDIDNSDSGISSGLSHSFDVGAASITVTATPDGEDYVTIGILEFSGLDSYDTGDSAVEGYDTTISVTFTTNYADVCVSYASNPYSLGVWVSGPTGYEEVYEGDSGGNNFGTSLYYKIQESSGEETPAVEWTSDGKGSMCGGGYQVAAAPAAGQPYFKRFGGVPHSITYRRW